MRRSPPHSNTLGSLAELTSAESNPSDVSSLSRPPAHAQQLHRHTRSSPVPYGQAGSQPEFMGAESSEESYSTYTSASSNLSVSPMHARLEASSQATVPLERVQQYRPHASKVGGYDAVFIDPVPESLQCPICRKALRAPVQTTSGHRFCKTCIDPIIASSGKNQGQVDRETVQELDWHTAQDCTQDDARQSKKGASGQRPVQAKTSSADQGIHGISARSSVNRSGPKFVCSGSTAFISRGDGEASPSQGSTSARQQEQEEKEEEEEEEEGAASANVVHLEHTDESPVGTSGGYDVQFTEPIDEQLKCRHSGLAARDPVQVPCGHSFCRSCVVDLTKNSGGSPVTCPDDDSPIDEKNVVCDATQEEPYLMTMARQTGVNDTRYHLTYQLKHLLDRGEANTVKLDQLKAAVTQLQESQRTQSLPENDAIYDLLAHRVKCLGDSQEANAIQFKQVNADLTKLQESQRTQSCPEIDDIYGHLAHQVKRLGDREQAIAMQCEKLEVDVAKLQQTQQILSLPVSVDPAMLLSNSYYHAELSRISSEHLNAQQGMAAVHGIAPVARESQVAREPLIASEPHAGPTFECSQEQGNAVQETSPVQPRGSNPVT